MLLMNEFFPVKIIHILLVLNVLFLFSLLKCWKEHKCLHSEFMIISLTRLNLRKYEHFMSELFIFDQHRPLYSLHIRVLIENLIESIESFVISNLIILTFLYYVTELSIICPLNVKNRFTVGEWWIGPR